MEETGVVVPACNLSTWMVEEGRAGIQGHSQLHTNFKVNVGYRRPFLKKERRAYRLLSFRLALLKEARTHWGMSLQPCSGFSIKTPVKVDIEQLTPVKHKLVFRAWVSY